MEWHKGELFPRVGFIVTNMSAKDFMRRFALPKEVERWSLRSVQLKLIKIGAKVISHSRKAVFQMEEVAVSEGLFAALLERIRSLAAVPT